MTIEVLLVSRPYIASVSIEGFRAISSPIELELAPLTILFGPNGSGKTSIIDAIVSTFSYALGISINDLSKRVNSACSKARVVLKIVGMGRDVVIETEIESRRISQRISFLEELKRKLVNEMKSREEVRILTLGKALEELLEELFGEPMLKLRAVALRDPNRYRVELEVLGRKELRKIIDRYGDKYVPYTEVLSKLLPMIWVPAWRDEIAASIPLRSTEFEGAMLPPVRILTTKSLIKECALLRLALGSKEFEDGVPRIAREMSIEPATAPRPRIGIKANELVIEMVAEAKDIEYPEELAADGERSLHVLIYALELGRRYGATIFIEEPELHLHPKLHWAVANLVIRTVKSGSQIVVSTHSDHFIAAVMRAISEGLIGRDEVLAYYVTRESGKTEVHRVDLDPRQIARYSHILSEFVEEDIAAYTRIVEQVLSYE